MVERLSTEEFENQWILDEPIKISQSIVDDTGGQI